MALVVGACGGPTKEVPGDNQGGTEGDATTPEGLVARSFTVRATVSGTDGKPPSVGQVLCNDFDFTARFEEEHGKWAIIAAVAGEQDEAALAADGSDYRAIRSDHAARSSVENDHTILSFPAGSCCERVLVDSLRVVLPWRDGFSATGTGVLTTEPCGGDVSEQADIKVELRGVPDRIAPQTILPHGPVHPFDVLALSFTEVVAGDVTATLTDGDASLPLERVGTIATDGPFWGFKTAPLLGFDRVLSWRVQGADLAGNAFVDSQAQVRSSADPGILPADGFESDVPALSDQQLEIVSKDAITGAHSFHAAWVGRTTFHLRHEGDGKGTVRFNARNLEWNDFEDEITTIHVTAAVQGGNKTVSLDLPIDTPASELAPSRLPPVHALQLQLPEEGKDVIVTFEMPPEDSDCGLASCQAVEALIDDLRVED